MTKTIKVLVVDDHQMFAQALELLLLGEQGLKITASVRSGEEALEAAEKNPPDVVLMDIDLPGMDGIEATRRLKELNPDTQVVVITAFQDRDVVARAVEAGACGYVPKARAPDGLLETIRRAAAGEIVLPAGDFRAVLGKLQETHRARSDAEALLGTLTSRELQVLQLMCDGKATGEIAEELFISPFTVQTHTKNITTKLGVHSKLEAVTFALRQGIMRIRF